MKINREELTEALDVAILTGFDDTRPEWDAFLKKHGRQPHHTFHYAACLLREITAPEYVPTEEMNEAGRSKYLEFFDFLPEDVPRPIFRAMIAELVEG